MISHYSFVSASDSIGRVKRNVSARRRRPFHPCDWLPTFLIATLLVAIPGPRLAAQPVFSQTPGPNLVGMSPTAMAVADFTGDGKPDVISSGFVSDGNEMYVILAGDGSGGFQFLQSGNSGPLPAGTMSTCLAVADFDGNGSPDFLRGLNDHGPRLYGITPAFIQGNLSGGSDSFAVGDFNGDGKLDFASIGKSGLSVQTGDGVRTFTESFSAAITREPAIRGGGCSQP